MKKTRGQKSRATVPLNGSYNLVLLTSYTVNHCISRKTIVKQLAPSNKECIYCTFTCGYLKIYRIPGRCTVSSIWLQDSAYPPPPTHLRMLFAAAPHTNVHSQIDNLKIYSAYWGQFSPIFYTTVGSVLGSVIFYSIVTWSCGMSMTSSMDNAYVHLIHK